jgi:glycosyltransferase involved in cell wall biosynthesis
MNKIIFVGTFLSHISGTLGISEKIERDLKSENLEIILVSRHKNKIIRILDIIFSLFFKKYNKVHIDTFSGQSFYITEIASIVAKARNKPIILTLHGGALPDFFLKHPLKVNRCFKKADIIQTPSLFLKDFFEQHNIKLNYLPNSINIKNFSFLRNEVKPHTLLWVRAFTSIYNPDLAIKTLYLVKKKYPNTTLTMIGPDKGLLKKMRILINQLNLNKSIIILGPIKNNELYKYYQTHEVFLNTTSFESFGVAVVEAASCGIPIVSSKVGEIPFIWEHKHNILMANQNAEEFAENVISLFKSKDLVKKITTYARKKAESFDWSVVRTLWVQVLS